MPTRSAPPPAVLLTDSLEKPSLDDRDYRVIRLDNELEALLVHDPETDKASAALDVNVGNFSDEDSMPGMAHAVEHVRLAQRSSHDLDPYLGTLWHAPRALTLRLPPHLKIASWFC
jgi:hypothetical protein